jgi:hypothetical protein
MSTRDRLEAYATLHSLSLRLRWFDGHRFPPGRKSRAAYDKGGSVKIRTCTVKTRKIITKG